MKQKKLLVFVAIIFVTSVAVATATAVVTTNLSIGAARTLPANDYEVFFIEGMPCVRVYRIDGISCDWSKWAGR